MSRERGSVLITVTWILSMLAVFSLALNQRVTHELFMGKWMRDRTITRAAAKAGIERVLFEVKADEFLTFDTLNESWASNETAFRDPLIGEIVLTVSCTDRLGGEDSKNDADVLYGACDESGRLNLNTATEEQIQKLLEVTDDSVDEKTRIKIAQSLIDWRDGDDATQSFGAEENFYKAFDDRMLPRNGPLESVEEFLMVRGMTSAIYEKVAPHVTVYTHGAVNFNTASLTVLRALGISEELALKIADFRKGEDLILGNEDDAVFQIVEGITPALSASGAFSSEEFAQISNLISVGAVSVQSEAFRIRSIGRLIRSSSPFQYEIEAVMTRNGTIKYWTERV